MDGYKAPQHPTVFEFWLIIFVEGVELRIFLLFSLESGGHMVKRGSNSQYQGHDGSHLGLFIIGFNLGPRFSE